MRWFVATVISIVLVSSVLSTEVDDDEPFLEILARSTIYNTGERKAIFCRGKNLVEPIKWYSPSGKLIEAQSLKNKRVYVERIVEESGEHAPLIIQYIKIADNGNWTCRSGDLSETIQFIVGEKVNITNRNVEREGEEGKSIVLTCEAKGHPTPVVVWYKENSRIPNDTKKYEHRADNSLEIKNLNHADVGLYVCKVRQKALSYYTDKTVRLSVLHKPILYNNFTGTIDTTKYKTEEVYAIMNETKNITCSAIANPPPTYTWYRRNNGYDDDVPITDEEMVVTSENGTYSVLILRMRDNSSIGEYKCTANNIKGKESIIFHVNPAAKPNKPDFVSFLYANTTTLTFNVSCSSCPMELEEDRSPDPANLTVKGYSFQMVPAQENYPPDWDSAQDFEVDITDPNDTLFTVGPLANKTKYHVRIRSCNAAGYSEWVYFETLLETSHASRIIAAIAVIIAAFTITSYF
ncbi:hemicentin-1-like [Bombyx mandarina]|uniref:Hemicentin-1-like n=1 Tax=Bombyx mandarina TaxID=7092 RepID=A0A6J2KKD8_BOMMA|nr:hemicentin-1-like [Bombyx mandarina]